MLKYPNIKERIVLRIFSKVGFLLMSVLTLLVWAPRQVHASTILPPKVSVVDEAGNKVTDNRRSELRYAPGSTHTLKVTVKNPSDGDSVRIKVNLAILQTTDDGWLDLMGVADDAPRLLNGAKPATSVFDLGDEGENFELGSGESRILTIQVTVPTDRIKGEQLYQLSVAADSADPLDKSDGQFDSRIIALMNPQAKLPKARLRYASFNASDYLSRRGFVVRVENPTGNVYRANQLTGRVVNDAQSIAATSRTLKDVEMAPYSYFDFFIPCADMTVGDYQVTMTSNGQQRTIRTQVKQLPAGHNSKQADKVVQWEQRGLLSLAIAGPAVMLLVSVGGWWQRVRKEARE
jgi:hypothetical protein